MKTCSVCKGKFTDEAPGTIDDEGDFVCVNCDDEEDMYVIPLIFGIGGFTLGNILKRCPPGGGGN